MPQITIRARRKGQLYLGNLSNTMIWVRYKSTGNNNKKLQPQVALDVGDEPWPLGHEASALVNVPPLLPNISKYMHLITTKKINMLKTP